MIRVAVTAQPVVEVYNDDGDLAGAQALRQVSIAGTSPEAIQRALDKLGAELARLFEVEQSADAPEPEQE